MKSRWLALVALVGLMAATAPAQEPVSLPLPAPNSAEVITVLAPGPAPWKVTKGDHVLWIFGYPEVVPAAFEWESARLERVLERSQEFVALPRIDLGTRTRMRREDYENPQGRTLAEVLPAEIYADYLAVKAEFFPTSEVFEQYRPHTVGTSLLANLSRQSGLVDANAVVRKIDALVRDQRGLRRTRIELEPTRRERAQLRRLGSALEAITHDEELRCFTGALANVRQDLDVLRQRAQAWAEGYVANLEDLQTSRERDNYCAIGLADTAERAIAERLVLEGWQRWYEAIDTALSRNESTVALVEIGRLIADGKDSLVQTLRNRGYTVEAP